jgi:hypothetical protein
MKSAQGFKLEAVVICNDFSDYLTRTLPTNKFIFDKLVVVTAPEDLETQRICEYYHCQCIKTDVLRSRWDEFFKGSAINEGMKALDMDGWVVHLDADIYLPPQTREILRLAELDPSFIYGIDRFNVTGYGAWDEFLSMPKLQHEANTYIHMTAFPLGARVMFRHAQGYLPLGYFQMWSPSASGHKEYPFNHGTAGRTDTMFAMQWPRPKRALIPEVTGYHLESGEKTSMGANWGGRTTKSFANVPLALHKLP